MLYCQKEEEKKRYIVRNNCQSYCLEQTETDLNTDRLEVKLHHFTAKCFVLSLRLVLVMKQMLNCIFYLSSLNCCHTCKPAMFIFSSFSFFSVCVSQPVSPGSEAGNAHPVRWRPAGALRISRCTKSHFSSTEIWIFKDKSCMLTDPVTPWVYEGLLSYFKELTHSL